MKIIIIFIFIICTLVLYSVLQYNYSLKKFDEKLKTKIQFIFDNNKIRDELRNKLNGELIKFPDCRFYEEFDRNNKIAFGIFKTIKIKEIYVSYAEHHSNNFEYNKMYYFEIGSTIQSSKKHVCGSLKCIGDIEDIGDLSK